VQHWVCFEGNSIEARGKQKMLGRMLSIFFFLYICMFVCLRVFKPAASKGPGPGKTKSRVSWYVLYADTYIYICMYIYVCDVGIFMCRYICVYIYIYTYI